MKVGVFSFVFQDLLSFDQALDWIAGVGALRDLILTDERGKPWFEA